MPQYLILAKDGSDVQTLDRRLNQRPHHLDRMKIEKEAGIFITGGATLNDKGVMNGSMLVIEIETLEAAYAWIKQDPYVLGGVWDKIEIIPFRMAQV